MATILTTADIFPCDSTSRVTLPVNLDPISGQPVRGPDGLRPGVIIWPRVEVDQGSADAPDQARYQAVAAIAAAQCMPPSGDVVIYDALDRCSFWLLGLVYDGTGLRPAAPPAMLFQMRASLAGSAPTLVSTGVISANTWNDIGLISQVSGYLCSQFELWLLVDPSEPTGTKIKVRIGGAADRVGGGVQCVTYGGLVTSPDPPPGIVVSAP